MEKQLIEKMIRNCLYQYQHTEDSVPLSKKDYEELYKQILALYKMDNVDLHEVVQDVVYEYLTNE